MMTEKSRKTEWTDTEQTDGRPDKQTDDKETYSAPPPQVSPVGTKKAPAQKLRLTRKWLLVGWN